MRDDTFNCLDRTPVCDEKMDGQSDIGLSIHLVCKVRWRRDVVVASLV